MEQEEKAIHRAFHRHQKRFCSSVRKGKGGVPLQSFGQGQGTMVCGDLVVYGSADLHSKCTKSA